jgi:exosortase/archaeosortase family protein
MAKKQNKVDRKNPRISIFCQQKQSDNPELLFAARFVLICSLFFFAIHTAPGTLLNPLNKHTAGALALTLQSIELPAIAHDAIVGCKGFGFHIIPECTFLFMGVLYSSFLVSYPSSWLLRITGILLGIPILYALNHLRLMVLYILGTGNRHIFEISHVYVGQIYTVIVVFLSCLLWIGVVSGKLRVRPIAAFLIRFTLISIPLFWLWSSINREYIGLIDRFLAVIFSIFDYNLVFKREYYLYYETFNIVTLIALICSLQQVPWRIRARGLAIGIFLAVLLHMFFRILNVFLTAFGFFGLFPISVLVTTTGQYLLPFLIVFTFSRERRG